MPTVYPYSVRRVPGTDLWYVGYQIPGAAFVVTKVVATEDKARRMACWLRFLQRKTKYRVPDHPHLN